MATQFIDGSVDDERLAFTTGSGGTLTGKARVVYDDTLDNRDLIVLIDRLRDQLLSNTQ